MSNRSRPRCPVCDRAMSPLFRKGPTGKAYVRVQDTFYCPYHNQLARGRDKVKFMA